SAEENAQMPEQALLLLRQQIVAPVQSGVQCPMTRQCGATSLRQQSEPVFETVRDVVNAECGGTRRGELDRQRDTVEASANSSDSRPMVRAFKCEARIQSADSGHEQLNGAMAEQIGRLDLG